MKFIKKAVASVKETYYKHSDVIYPWTSFTRNCIADASMIKEDPRIWDYLDFAFRIKDNYEDSFSYNKSTTFNFNTEDGWEVIFNKLFASTIVGLIKLHRSDHVRLYKKADDRDGHSAYILDMEGLKFGWIETGTDFVSFWRYNDPDSTKEVIEEKTKVAIKALFRQAFPGGKIVVSMKDETLLFEEDKRQADFIKFKKCTDLVTYINKYWDKEENRSIIFYGPPGSGKSNLIKGILQELHARTLKFENFHQINMNSLTEIITYCDADAIVFEDIDHARSDLTDFLLAQVEELSQSCRLILASANVVSNLDNALLRPGRFDEAVEIKRLDNEVIMSLVGGDKDIFEKTKNFPVAYIKELMKRVKVLGRDEALKTIKDLEARVDNLLTSNYSLKKNGVDEAKRKVQEEEEELDYDE